MYKYCIDLYIYIQKLYETMKLRVDEVMKRGRVGDEYVTHETGRKALSRWTGKNFDRQDHPAIVEVRTFIYYTYIYVS